MTISISSEGTTRKFRRDQQCLNILNEHPFFEGKYFIEIPSGIKFSAVYTSVKDMLTHSNGFLAMANKYRDFPFDKTLTDGTVVFENDEFYIRKRDGRLIKFELEAEGLKKIGLLRQLLMTDNLTENSILIWDEPEANLNPKFLPQLVECLLELSRHGI